MVMDSCSVCGVPGANVIVVVGFVQCRHNDSVMFYLRSSPDRRRLSNGKNAR